MFAAACGTGGRGGAPGEAVLVQVNNNLIPPTVISVYLVREGGGGGRRLLGTVTPGSETTLRYTGVTAGGNYRLVARATAGRDIPSTPFSLIRGGTVNWDLQSGIATVSAGTP
jgi:hypothetical protein